MSLPTLEGTTLYPTILLPTRRKKTSRIQIPEKSGTVKQYLGFESRQWSITGHFKGSTKTTDRDAIKTLYDDNTTSTFVDDESDSYEVKILDFVPVNVSYGTKINYTMLLEEV